MSRSAIPLTDPIAAAYITWSERERVPANTIRRRRAVLRSVGNAGTATREEVEAWWDRRRPLKDSTRANDLAVLRSFYTWCQIWEHRTDNPTVRLRPPRAGTGAPQPTTRREFDRILEHIATLGDEAPALRRAVLLAAGAGLRREEVARLGWLDIDPETLRARVTGKGRKTRIVTLSPKLLEQLLPAVDDQEQEPARRRPPTTGNVVTGRPTGWAPDTLGRKVNAAIRDAGVPGTFHKLRHRYGSVAYQMTKDPKALAEQMGHASVATTLAFYAAAADDAAQAIAAAVTEGW